MSTVVCLSMLLSFSLTIALLFPKGRREDEKKRRLGQIIRKLPEETDEEMNLPFAQRFLLPLLLGLLKAISRLFSQNRQKDNQRLEKKLLLAGIRMPAGEYSAARLMVMLAVFGLSFLAALFVEGPATKYAVFLAGAALSVLGPSLFLSGRIRTRQQAIRNQMPDILDLLTVSVEAGLGLDGAVLKIRERFSGPLVEELMLMQREIQMALPRRAALLNLAERNSLPELKTFSGALIQAEQLGIPIRNVLRTQSAQLRLLRKQIAEEKAMKAPVKMMLPLILFVFPVIFIILLGPTVLQIMDTFGI